MSIVAGESDADIEGDEQDDSSSAHMARDISQHLQDLTISEQNSKEEGDVDALVEFRQQWQRELVVSGQQEQNPSPITHAVLADADPPLYKLDDPQHVEELAKQVFAQGVEEERGGRLYEAVRCYRRAVQLLPDVETRLYAAHTTHTAHPASSTGKPDEPVESDEDMECESGESGQRIDLERRFQRIVARQGCVCQPAIETKGAHLSWLPAELVAYIVRWVVGAELDTRSLARLAAVCRGLYLAATAHHLYRDICAKTWGLNCGSLAGSGYGSWRRMYELRPRLRCDGCYISKTSYLRHGENSFQDQFYRPWYLVEYYRYLRFFPEGCVLMWTTAEEPAACVPQLRTRTPRPHLPILAGHYRLLNDKVVIVVKKNLNNEKKAAAANTRFRSRRVHEITPEQSFNLVVIVVKKNLNNEKKAAAANTRFRSRRVHEITPEQSFNLELQVCDARRRRNWQLRWRAYAAVTQRGNADSRAQFDVTPTQYPPFYFSPVTSYTVSSDAPL